MGKIMMLVIVALVMTAFVPSLVPLAVAQADVNTPANEHHDHPGKYPKAVDPICYDFNNFWHGLCGTIEGVDCRITSGNPLGGWVYCENGLVCFVQWGECNMQYYIGGPSP